MECDIDLAAEGIATIARQSKAEFDAAIMSANMSGDVTIIDHYTENIDSDMYPLLMIQEVSESYSWAALPAIAEEAFVFNLYGLVQHDNPAIAVKARRKFSGAVKKAFNRRHLGIRVQGVELEFASVNGSLPPVYSISYNLSYQANPQVRGFVATIAVYCHPSIPDISGVP